MKSTNCLTSSMIKVGDILERKISFTHQDVVDYCNLAKDFNAIHHDIEAARLRFPNIKDIVVPGALLQISIAGILEVTFQAMVVWALRLSRNGLNGQFVLEMSC